MSLTSAQLTTHKTAIKSEQDPVFVVRRQAGANDSFTLRTQCDTLP